jgi:hypothetical protein
LEVVAGKEGESELMLRARLGDVQRFRAEIAAGRLDVSVQVRPAMDSLPKSVAKGRIADVRIPVAPALDRRTDAVLQGESGTYGA